MIEAAEGKDLGAMAAVKAGAPDVRRILSGIEGVVVANINSPLQTVISGEREAVGKASELLRSKDIPAQPINVAGAFHSYLVAPAKERFAQYLKGIAFARARVQVYSNTHAAPYGSGPEDIAAVLSEHLVKPVDFAGEIEAMYDGGARIFVEAGPGSVLTNLTRQILKGRRFVSVATDIQGHSAIVQFLKAMGQLSIHGVDISFDRIYRGRGLKAVRLDGAAPEDRVSPAAWLVNGSGARPYKAVAISKKTDKVITGEENAVMKADRSGLENPAPLKDAGQETGGGTRHQSSEDVDPVMIQYQQTMNRFLETQQNIMLAYLQGNPQPAPHIPVLIPDRPRTQGTVTHRTEQTAAPPPQAQKSPAAQAEKPPPPAQVNEGTGLKEELLRITSERTGYPVDMLDLNSDMEADLGIDSIKRVEILSAYAKCFPGEAQKQALEMMDELSKLKTLNAVIERSAGFFLRNS